MYGIDFVRLDYRISKWNNFMIHVGSGLLKLGFILRKCTSKYSFLQKKENNLSYPRLSKVCL